MTLEVLDTVLKHSDRAHALYSFSQASRWTACTGSLLLSKDIPDPPPSKDAEEGTLFHEWLEKTVPLIVSGKYAEFKELINQIEDEEMATYVVSFGKDVKDLIAKFHRPDDVSLEVLNEERVSLEHDMWGTLDLGILAQRSGKEGAKGGPIRRDLVIIDAKYGRGVIVSPENNLQLLGYALSIDKEYNHNLRNIYLYIYQPRTPGDAWSMWKPTREELQKAYSFLIEKRRENAKVLDGELEPSFNPGDHCRFCKALGVCKAVGKKIKDERLIDVQKLEEVSDPVKINKKGKKKEVDNFPAIIKPMGLEQLTRIVSNKKLIERYLEAVEHYLLGLAQKGTKIPGYKIVHSRARRSWLKDTEKVARGLAELGLDPYKKKLINIGEAELELGEGKLNKLTEYSQPKQQLVLESDPREAIDLQSSLSLLDSIPSEVTEGLKNKGKKHDKKEKAGR